MPKPNSQKIPAYISAIYHWLYLNPKLYAILDNSILLNVLTCGGHYLLTEELKKEITPNAQTLQIGVTLGSQIEKTYSALNMSGLYTITDVIPQMLEYCHEKHLEKRIIYQHTNAAKSINEKYDTIICYMLLHELPPQTRKQLIDNILKALPFGGKAIFIDYHQPTSLNPLKYIIRTINRLYQPFAEALWKTPIKELTQYAENYSWSKQTYFGGIYQKVVATRES